MTKDTLVIATGDNGAAKRACPPLRASKSSIYEGGHREPDVVERLKRLMQSCIDRGRSTPGADRKNEFELSVSFGKDGNKKKRKQARQQQ